MSHRFWIFALSFHFFICLQVVFCLLLEFLILIQLLTLLGGMFLSMLNYKDSSFETLDHDLVSLLYIIMSCYIYNYTTLYIML